MINYVEPYHQKMIWYRMPHRKFWLMCQNANRVSPGLLEQVHNWSKEHRCGIRMSWETYKFKSETEITIFLLKWA